jgi:DNA replication and repair protein RecF
MLKKIKLENFRSFAKKELNFDQLNNLIIGNNGVGKTNILESLFLLSTGKSFRAHRTEQMIKENYELARVTGKLNEQVLEIVLTNGQVSGQKSPKKRYLLNGVAKRRLSFAGQLPSVLFRPEDINLILGSPSLRRDYLDMVLEQIDWQYRRSSLAYSKGLRQRNKLLRLIRDNKAQARQLLFWDKILIKNGELISRKRGEFIDFVNQQFNDWGIQVKLIYDQSAISPGRLDKYTQAEIASGMTLVGPHRDDLIFERQGKNLAEFGSRGEQRMAILDLKMSELDFVRENNDNPPLLLLDDIFSELDEQNRTKVWQIVNHQQTVITATETEFIDSQFLGKIKQIEL